MSNLTFSDILERCSPEVCEVLHVLPPVAQDRLLYECNRYPHYLLTGFRLTESKHALYAVFTSPIHVEARLWETYNDGPLPQWFELNAESLKSKLYDYEEEELLERKNIIQQIIDLFR